MNKRKNVVAALVTFTGLVLLAPASSGSPQEPKPEPKKEDCRCVDVHEHDLRVQIPHVVLPDGERFRHQVEEALAQARVWDHRAWRDDAVRMSDELRAQLADQRGEWEQQAREWADLAQQGTAVFIEDGESGWLGVSIYEVTDEKAKELKLAAVRGVLIGEVESDSAAAKAGIKEGDVITDFNGQRVEGTVQFRRLVRETIAGRTVPVTVWRDGRAQNLQVEMGTRTTRLRESIRVAPRIQVSPNFRFETMPPLELFASRTPTLGISGEDLSGDLGAYFGAPDGEGVLVKEVHSDTAAEKAGMKAGDVITSFDGDRIRTLADLRSKLRETRESKTMKVDILRKGQTMSLNVEIEQPKPPTPRRVTRRISA